VASVFVLRSGLLGFIAGAALLLAACSGRDPYVSGAVGRAGEWNTEKHIDRITGAPVSNSFLATRKVSYGAILFPPPARLQLVCFKEQPAILVGFDFKIGSTRNAEVAYRFDEKPGHEPHLRIVDDHKTVLIDDAKEVAQFVGDMATSENLYLRIRALTAPRTSAEFTVAGAGPMIAAAYASCPLNPDIARRNASARASQKDDD
jgi:hypothetical protein